MMATEALREALAEIQEEIDDEPLPLVRAGLRMAHDAVRVVLNRCEQEVTT